MDREGRVRTAAADGMHCLASDGRLIGKVPIPEFVANARFGDAKLNRHFIRGTTSLYAVYLMVNGISRV